MVNGQEQELVNVEHLIKEVQTPTFVIPSEVEDQVMEAVHELEILAETPMTFTLPEVSAEVVMVPEVILSEQLAAPEVTQIIKTNPEIIPEINQAVKTFESLKIAGVEEAQAEAKVSVQVIKIDPVVAKAMVGEEEEKKKKRRFKFIKDKIALNHIFKAWKKAIESAPIKKEAGQDVIDSIDALALMPTEVQDSGVKSGILPEHILEWLNFGDGAYRTALTMAKDIGLRSRQVVLEKVFALHQKYYPVTIAEDGEEAAKSNVELVLTHKPNPIKSH